MKLKIMGMLLLACFCFVPLAPAADLAADELLNEMKSSLDLGFKQQDALRPVLAQYVKILKLLREQGAGNERALKGQIQGLNQQLEQELKNILTGEQMMAFQSVKRSLLAS